MIYVQMSNSVTVLSKSICREQIFRIVIFYFFFLITHKSLKLVKNASFNDLWVDEQNVESVVQMFFQPFLPFQCNCEVGRINFMDNGRIHYILFYFVYFYNGCFFLIKINAFKHAQKCIFFWIIPSDWIF